MDRGTVLELPGPGLAWAAAEEWVALAGPAVAGPVVAVERAPAALVEAAQVRAAAVACGNRAECPVAEEAAV